LSEQDEAAATSAPEGNDEGAVGATTAEAGAVGTVELDLDQLDAMAVVLDDLGGQSFSDAVDATIVEFDDGDIVKGIVVKIDNDEVLLDIGYKSEGVIPSRELSIRNDVDPHEVVALQDEIEALVLTKEDKDGRLVPSRARSSRSSRAASSSTSACGASCPRPSSTCAGSATSSPSSGARSSARSSSSTATATTWSSRGGPISRRPSASSATSSSPTSSPARSAAAS
jgi:hypothetical protein